MARLEKQKEKEDSFLLGGLKQLMVQITEQNAINIGKIVECLVTKKEEPAISFRTALVTKPAMVPNWTEYLSFETYIKQLETWNKVNVDMPTNTKYQDFVENQKINKENEGLP